MMNQKEYWDKIKEFSEKNDLAQLEYNKFRAENKDFIPNAVSEEKLQEHADLVNAIASIAITWQKFCSDNKLMK
ncbi:MAG: hypothetical protein V4805_17595 [Pseudomonadota bacterium]